MIIKNGLKVVVKTESHNDYNSTNSDYSDDGLPIAYEGQRNDVACTVAGIFVLKNKRKRLGIYRLVSI